ncbi:hypothetical protein KSB_94020 [Ktedonobacter robiniae]|uniref:Uncharacterized protein n=1 Tax=Ktedonobacter robiniae TaxID=2778365 RepID=A0ABQ3V8R5_9CHLR|nr:hypothetical protein KSB_94020 [Ktedonobacter robiniae]
MIMLGFSGMPYPDNWGLAAPSTADLANGKPKACLIASAKLAYKSTTSTILSCVWSVLSFVFVIVNSFQLPG